MSEENIWKERRYTLKSKGAMLLHNSRLADPLDEIKKDLDKISSKRMKVDADYQQMAKLEFLGSLYLNKNKELILPGRMFFAMIIKAAKSKKKGQDAKIGIICQDDLVLDYGDKRTPEELVEDPEFRLSALVNIQKNKIMRTRPKINEWKGEIIINYNTEIINPAELDEWMQYAGKNVGLGDWRPVYGRFEIIKIV